MRNRLNKKMKEMHSLRIKNQLSYFDIRSNITLKQKEEEQTRTTLTHIFKSYKNVSGNSFKDPLLVVSKANINQGFLQPLLKKYKLRDNDLTPL